VTRTTRVYSAEYSSLSSSTTTFLRRLAVPVRQLWAGVWFREPENPRMANKLGRVQWLKRWEGNQP